MGRAIGLIFPAPATGSPPTPPEDAAAITDNAGNEITDNAGNAITENAP